MIVNPEALDILAADINDEIDVGTEFLCGGIMCNGLDNAAVDAECFLDDILTVAGDSGAAEADLRIFFIDAAEVFADCRGLTDTSYREYCRLNR